MLRALREKKILNVFLWIVIIAFLATIVVVWGLGENQKDMNYAAKVGGKIITVNEYSNAYEQARAQMQQIFGDSFEEMFDQNEFEKMVLENIIENRLLMIEADKLKIPVTNAEVAAQIIRSNVFTDDYGNFDTNVYQETLKYYGLTPPVYEAQIKTDITMNKMRQLIDSTVSISDAELEHEYVYQNTKLSASYFVVNPANYISNDQPDERALEEYFAVNSERYRLPAEVKLKYISFSPEEFVYDFSPSEDELRARYTANVAAYTVPESVDLSQIVKYVTNWTDSEEVAKIEAEMEAALAEINAGAPFGVVAAKYSDAVGTSGDGHVGTIEYPQYGELDELYQNIFNLDSGESSDVIKSDFGYHIFKVNSHQRQEITPFEAVKDSIAESIKAEARSGAYRNYLYSTYRELINAGNITAYLQKNPDAFKAEETGFLAQDDPDAFFQADKNLKDTIFALGKTEISTLMDFDGKTYIYEIVDRINSSIPALDDIKATVIADYKREEALKAAQAAISAEFSGQMDSAEFAQKAAGFNGRIEKIPAFSRNLPPVEVEWLPGDLMANEPNDVVTYPGPRGERIYVIHIDEKIIPSLDGLADSREAIESYLLSAKRADATKGYIESLKAKYKVEINPTFTAGR